jgi:branched-chain amino acid transport system permease protein
MKQGKNVALFLVAAVALLVLPLLLQSQGNAWVRIADIALLYVLLALGLNIVVGYAGLLDLGYVAFFAIGAYMFALLGSPHLTDTFPAIKAMFPNGLHSPLLLVIPLGLGLAAFFGVLLGAPTLKLRGDYLAIVTLGFGEIIRVFLNNLDYPVNITNGPKGITAIDPIHFWGLNLGKPLKIGDYTMSSVTLYYYLFLALVTFTIIISHRLQVSRIGRAWMAIREDEIAAKAMGINTRNMKLLAFGMGASFGGVSGSMFAAFQGFVSPESFALSESVMIVAMVVLGGIGHLPGVVLGAVLLAALPEVLRYVAGPLQAMTGGRLDSSILRQLFIALAMIIIMLVRPRGLWPSPEHGKSLARKGAPPAPVPGSTQAHAPGVPTPADEVPGEASRPMSINP